MPANPEKGLVYPTHQRRLQRVHVVKRDKRRKRTERTDQQIRDHRNDKARPDYASLRQARHRERGLPSTSGVCDWWDTLEMQVGCQPSTYIVYYCGLLCITPISLSYSLAPGRVCSENAVYGGEESAGIVDEWMLGYLSIPLLLHLYRSTLP